MSQRDRKIRTADEKALLRVLGRQLAAWRQARKITQEGLAEKAGIGMKYVSEIERGITNPTVLLVWRLSQALDVELWEVCWVSPADKGEEGSKRAHGGRLLKNRRGKELEQVVEILKILCS